MKISIRTIMSAIVASFLVGAAAPAQTNYAIGESAPTSQAVSGPVDSVSADMPPAPGQYVAAASNAYEEAMYGEMMAEDYGLSRPESMSLGSRRIFVIPSTQIEMEEHLAIERDIRVMSHIFDRVLRKPVNKLGGVFTVMDDFFGRDSHVTQAVYLDGYGALFFMDVDFALVGPPQPLQTKEPNEPEVEVDTTWQQAERELYTPSRTDARRRMTGRSRPQYDAEKVELLKRNLVETLKHAANIKALGSDESVILMIAGRPVIATATIYMGKNVGWSFKSGKWVPSADDYKATPSQALLPSVLTIRAKKSDIDAFSKGELDFAGFYERTQILVNWAQPTSVSGYYPDPMQR